MGHTHTQPTPTRRGRWAQAGPSGQKYGLESWGLNINWEEIMLSKSIHPSVDLFVRPSIHLCVFCFFFSGRATVGCGLSFLQFVYMNERRSLFIVGFSVYMGISVPFYFTQYATSAGHGPVTTDSHWVKTSSRILDPCSRHTYILYVALTHTNWYMFTFFCKRKTVQWLRVRAYDFGRDSRAHRGIGPRLERARQGLWEARRTRLLEEVPDVGGGHPEQRVLLTTL